MFQPASEIDLQRSLFRLLTKSARQGQAADPAAARRRLAVLSDDFDLDRVADGMQRRLTRRDPNAPDLRLLLESGAPDHVRDGVEGTHGRLSAMQSYDWVSVGIYAFGLPPTKTQAGTPESSAHRALKEWAAAHGEVLGAPADAVAHTERWFPSGHEADVAFIGAHSALPDASPDVLIVEVRPRGAEPHELRQAVFSLVAMRAVLDAEQSLAADVTAVRVQLVIEDEPPVEIRELAAALSVELYVR